MFFTLQSDSDPEGINGGLGGGSRGGVLRPTISSQNKINSGTGGVAGGGLGLWFIFWI